MSTETRTAPILRWTQAPYGRGLQVVVPQTAGIYAVVDVERLHGLPVRTDWLYVGQSKNLRRRYCEHTDWREPNPHLDAVRRTYTHEFWWVSCDVELLNVIEADLIDALKPPGNRKKGNRRKSA